MIAIQLFTILVVMNCHISCNNASPVSTLCPSLAEICKEGLPLPIASKSCLPSCRGHSSSGYCICTKRTYSKLDMLLFVIEKELNRTKTSEKNQTNSSKSAEDFAISADDSPDSKKNIQYKNDWGVNPKRKTIKTKVTCQNCGKSVGKCKLNRHMLIHTGQKPYACKMCAKKFSRRDSLNKHSLIHSDQKPYACNLCDRKFTRKDNLNIHSLIHSRQKPYKCEICGNDFNHKSDKNRHMSIHRENKPHKYKCCIESFPYKYKLIKHLLSNDDSMPSHTGVHCGKTYPNQEILDRHLRNHSNEFSLKYPISSHAVPCKSSRNMHPIIKTKSFKGIPLAANVDKSSCCIQDLRSSHCLGTSIVDCSYLSHNRQHSDNRTKVLIHGGFKRGPSSDQDKDPKIPKYCNN